ncbi:MAG: fatty acid--CoA ligase [Proteobacteria bacterium]|nr:fatty acid--CoA ligase [Pseudomonadota bacterium]MBU4383913.1 fatty acid--CoA ligase [Pseudomonadota bacterium]
MYTNQGTRLIEKTPSAYDYPLLIKQLLHTPIVQAPDQEIVYRDKRRFNYRQLYERVHRLGSGLNKIGVAPGNIVAFLDWDSYRYLEAYFAVPSIGAVLHTVNVRLSPEQILYTMNHAGDTAVFVHQDFLSVIESIADRLPNVKRWVLLREPGTPLPETSLNFDAEYEDVLAMGDPKCEFPEFDENSMATLGYTTGTTGDPKGVYFSHRQLILHTLSVTAGFAAMKAVGGLRSEDVYMPMTPMFHVHAWGFPYVATMLGIKQVYPGRYEPDMLVKLYRDEGVTFSHCVPTIMNMVLDCPAASETDFSRLKVSIGGSALPRGLASRALDLGIDIFSGYGMSETCPVLAICKLGSRVRALGRESQVDYRIMTGMPIPLVDMRVVDLNMKPLPRDGQSVGEICVRSPWLTQGYLGDVKKSEELWYGGYLHTKDVAVQNQEGYFKIIDRTKDVIKTGGEWVSSLELETLISQHPDVSEVAVVGVSDSKWGERPLALVVLNEGRKADVDSIKKFLQQFVDKGVINKWGLPEQIKITDAIPKTSVGKIDKKSIRAGLWLTRRSA